MSELIEQAQAGVADAEKALASAEQQQKDAEAEFKAAELAAPRFTQTDLAKSFQRESQARRAGLIA
jgi:hypothetical protein